MKTKLVLMIVAIISFGCQNANSQKVEQTNQKVPHETVQQTNQKVTKGKVQSSYVCYVNNKYMGKEQIPVEVDGKTYYGCCNMCVGKLQNNESARTANDPLTGNKVDKATAYIVIKENSDGEVLYFENKKNYTKYISK